MIRFLLDTNMCIYLIKGRPQKALKRLQAQSISDVEAAAVYSHIRASLETQDVPISPLDNLITAHALSLRCVLVTNNQRRFSRLPGLLTENWLH